MLDEGRDPVPTRSAFLDLSAERGFVREGREFLDHKRMLLAAEILRQVGRYEVLREQAVTLQREARRSLAEAVALHGPGGMDVHPAGTLEMSLPTRGGFLGVPAVTVDPLHAAPPEDEDALFASPEVRRCRARFQELVGVWVQLAALSINLERLLRDYRRTERRARALEDVILPELTRAIDRIAERLEEVDQEEVLRSRRSARGV